MLKTFVKALAIGSLLLAVAAAPSRAQEMQHPFPHSAKDAKVFLQDMPGDAWSKLIAASLNLKFLVGKPIVAVFNPSDEEVINVVCDGKWSLVGEGAYNKDKGAPAGIAPHSVVLIPTDGFDGYCTQGIVALTDTGTRLDGELSIPGDFTNSTSIFLTAKK